MANHTKVLDTDIIEYFIAAPLAEAQALYRWLGAALSARVRVANEVRGEGAAARGPAPLAQVSHTPLDTLHAHVAHPTDAQVALATELSAPPLKRRRRRRTRAEIDATAGPATATVVVAEGAVPDPGLPPEEIEG